MNKCKYKSHTVEVFPPEDSLPFFQRLHDELPDNPSDEEMTGIVAQVYPQRGDKDEIVSIKLVIVHLNHADAVSIQKLMRSAQ